jgi:hypothetical protein
VNAAAASAAYDLRPALLPDGTLLPDGAPLPEGQDEVSEVPVRQCGRCGAVGTHYLTCPALRLPPGYRISDPGRGPR